MTSDQIYSMICRIKELKIEINNISKIIERQNELLEKNTRFQEEMLKIFKNK